MGGAGRTHVFPTSGHLNRGFYGERGVSFEGYSGEHVAIVKERRALNDPH